MVELGIDPSVFARAAELLARPLSPTVAEREAAETSGKASATPHRRGTCSRNSASSRASPSRTTRTSPSKSRCQTAKQPVACDASGPFHTSSKEPETVATSEAAVNATGAVNRVDEGNAETSLSPPNVVYPASAGENVDLGSISGAVAMLGDLQREMKEKMQSPSMRKARPPKVRRPPSPKVLTDKERNQKLSDIGALEQQLSAAKGRGPVNADVAGGSDDKGTEHQKEEPSEGADAMEKIPRQAADCEERVRTRKRQEAHERRERERQVEAEKEAKRLDGEAKAKELKRQATLRVQERLREERAREEQQRLEEEREKGVREHRSAESDELRRQAQRRVVEHEVLRRQQVNQLAEADAEQRKKLHEDNEARAAELREKTRLRVQQHARERREQQLLEEENQRQLLEEQARLAKEREEVKQISQQRARARAAEFRQRHRQEEEERLAADEEAKALELARADAALKERQKKRQWRPGDPVVETCSSYQTGCGGAGSDCDLSNVGNGNRSTASSGVPPKLPLTDGHVAASSSAAADTRSASKGQSETCVPQQALKRVSQGVASRSGCAVGNVEAAPVTECRTSAKPQPRRRVESGRAASEVSSATAASSDNAGKPAPPAKEAARVDWGGSEGALPLQCPVATVGDDDTVRCTVGFFGVADGCPEEDDFGEASSAGVVHLHQAVAAKGDAATRSASRSQQPPRISGRVATRRPISRDASSVDGGSESRGAGAAVGRIESARSSGSGQQSPHLQKATAQRAAFVRDRRRTSCLPRAQSQPPPRRRALAQDVSRTSSPGAENDAPPTVTDETTDIRPLSNGGNCSLGSGMLVPLAKSNAFAAVDSHQLPICGVGGVITESERKKRAAVWKQKAIQVQSAAYYLDMVKAARGNGGDEKRFSSVGRGGSYGEQMRQRASDVEDEQRREEGERLERGSAVLQRLQQRGLQAAPARSVSCEGL
eukprot:TRINITY_DN75006_c0_g1_i1.p1 TRINITY_DN75006_c0_g1~~TRINITY_DN75006_c0_g1_i1.p1  ORF type:complete len:953 (+),score=188.54 TRINITY_DN75006_c0_g1_i1:147-3005(+)